MESGSSVSSEEKSEVFLLLEEYCSKRSLQRSAQLSQQTSQQRPRSKSQKRSRKKSSRTSQHFGNTETTVVEFQSAPLPGPSSSQNEGECLVIPSPQVFTCFLITVEESKQMDSVCSCVSQIVVLIQQLFEAQRNFCCKLLLCFVLMCRFVSSHKVS